MSLYKRVMLVSPIKEFHSYLYGTELDEKYLKILFSTIEWVKDYLLSKNLEVIDILNLASIKGNESTHVLRKLFASKTWNRIFRKECMETLTGWADVVALMPESRSVSSEIVESIVKEAKERFIPVVNVESLIDVSEGELKKELERIEDAHLAAHRRSKILNRGSRTR